MIAAGANFPFTAGADHVAGAVLVSTEKRAPAMDPLLLRWFGRIEWNIWTLRISGHDPSLRQLRVVIWPIPIAAPFPDVPGDVIKPVGMGRELRNRCNARETILARILDRK